MADRDNDSTDAPVPTQTPPSVADLKPGTHRWLVWVAMCAHQFFSIVHDPEAAAAIGKSAPADGDGDGDGPPKTLPFDPWSIYDFSRYLGARGLPNANNSLALTKVLGSLERAGLLWLVGRDPQLPIMAEQYVTTGRVSKVKLAETYGCQGCSVLN